ncbi:MAG: hypothetical protein KBC81_00095 [Candidatus Pacebacteria bacterium]|nr:hypothetical protein [Candidatus Paceibacterota bacterium]
MMNHGKWTYLRVLPGRIKDMTDQLHKLSDEAVQECHHRTIISCSDAAGSLELCKECGLIGEVGVINSSASREVLPRRNFEYQKGAMSVPVRGPSPLFKK